MREGAGKAGTSGDARPTNAGWASDEPVVVMNPVPMNAGNSWEGKTQGTDPAADSDPQLPPTIAGRCLRSVAALRHDQSVA